MAVSGMFRKADGSGTMHIWVKCRHNLSVTYIKNTGAGRGYRLIAGTVDYRGVRVCCGSEPGGHALKPVSAGIRKEYFDKACRSLYNVGYMVL